MPVTRRPVTTFDLLLLGGTVLLLCLLAGPVLTIPLHIPINYNEGWNAAFDRRAVTAGAGPLYPGPDSLVFDNYPPLGFVVVGGVGRLLGGDMILAGRLVALVAMLATGSLVGVCARRLGAPVRAAAASALLMLLLACTFYGSYVAMADPQWLAHAMMLAGLATLLGADGRAGLGSGRARPSRVALAAAIMVAGGFVKHNLVALPIATTLLLLWLDRRAAIAWIAGAAATLAAGVALTGAVFGTVSFEDVLHHRRVFHAGLTIGAVPALAPLIPAAIVLCVCLPRSRAGDGARLIGLFAILALGTGILQRTGDGVNYNAQFETLIAVCLGAGVAIGTAFEVPARPSRWRVGPSVLLALAAAPVLIAMRWHLPSAWHQVADRHVREAAWRPMIARLAAERGPVGCEMQSLCVWAGKPFTVDVFNLTQRILADGPSARLEAMPAVHPFALFEIDPTASTHTQARRYGGRDPVLDALRKQDRTVMAGPDGTQLLAPVR